MRCSSITELPPPSPGKTGWPWTEETPPLPTTMPNGSPWPRIPIVTPSFNQEDYIEPVKSTFGFVVFYPSLPSSQTTDKNADALCSAIVLFTVSYSAD